LRVLPSRKLGIAGMSALAIVLCDLLPGVVAVAVLIGVFGPGIVL
jgi:hypothetical protein